MIKARVEVALAVLFACAAAVTALWPRWIEEVTGLEPDAGSGAAEWGIVVAVGLLAAGSALLARRDYRLAQQGP